MGTTFTWHEAPVPEHMPVKQVYGFCFGADGALLMRVDGDNYSLPGGRPEARDNGFIGTLARECLEEVQIEIQKAHYLGFQGVDDGDGRTPYAQVRMVALISSLKPSIPDIDTGRTYRRLFTSAQRGGQLLNWGDLGRIQASCAARMAEKYFGISTALGIHDSYV